MISFCDVRYVYPEQTLLFPDITVSAGEKLFVRGQSGSGKSTLLSLLAGIYLPQRGTITINGKNITALHSFARDRFRASSIGYIFQQFNLITYLTVYQNIELTLKMSKERAKRLQKTPAQEIHALAEKLQISSILHKSASSISVGQAQRTACARALIGNPSVILADEPTSALDQENRDSFLKLLLESLQDSILVFVSHDATLEKNFDRSITLQTQIEEKSKQ